MIPSEDRRIACAEHGDSEARFVCDHLFANRRSSTPSRLTFYEPRREPGTRPPAIWCAECEAVVARERAINDVVDEFARFHAVCGACFGEYLAPNEPADPATAAWLALERRNTTTSRVVGACFLLSFTAFAVAAGAFVLGGLLHWSDGKVVADVLVWAGAALFGVGLGLKLLRIAAHDAALRRLKNSSN